MTTETETPANNLHAISSTPHFQSLMSADLTRVAVITFWAPWAEPCKRMNEFIEKDLANRYPHVLFLMVEAEEQQDITESFDIEAVPAVVILKGHTSLDRLAGADQAGLSASLERHGRIVNKPLSYTDNAPAKPSTTTILSTQSETTTTTKDDANANANVNPGVVVVEKEEEEETTEELNARLRGLMNQAKVVLFMKGSPDAPRCGFSRKIVALLGEQGVDFKHFDILTDESVRQGLKVLNEWPTFPQLIVDGELVGGLDIVKEMAENGELKELLAG